MAAHENKTIFSSSKPRIPGLRCCVSDGPWFAAFHSRAWEKSCKSDVYPTSRRGRRLAEPVKIRIKEPDNQGLLGADTQLPVNTLKVPPKRAKGQPENQIGPACRRLT